MKGCGPIGLIAISATLLYGVAFSDGVQLGYGFAIMMFLFPFTAILGQGEAFKIFVVTMWWLIPALPGILGLLMLLKKSPSV
ncbi:MAG: hypothetical protein K2W81_13955 [Sphingomonas sp.]|uniref:hypothetical protein n=1 Tax=Sphingomonas sp. TaxID=28214 RepID=UPI0025ED6AE0|nr:hypothetical protein [Sphingomonas sp.]MBY0285051.1 hypothetical protein [Sphingomonas sp.]